MLAASRVRSPASTGRVDSVRASTCSYARGLEGLPLEVPPQALGPLLYLGSPWHTREGVSYEPGTVRARSGQAIEATCHGVITLRSRPAVSSVLESKVKTKAPLGRPTQAGTAQRTGGWKQRTQKPWETSESQAGRNPGHSVATWVRATFQPTYLFQIGT